MLNIYYVPPSLSEDLCLVLDSPPKSSNISKYLENYLTHNKLSLFFYFAELNFGKLLINLPKMHMDSSPQEVKSW